MKKKKALEKGRSRQVSRHDARPWRRASLRGAASLAACATPPKPRELEAYEMLRKDNNMQEATKKSPDLVAGAEKLGEKSREEWQSNDLEDSRRDALMANIKLKTALALMEQEQLKAKIQTLSAEQAKARGGVRPTSRRSWRARPRSWRCVQKYVEARKTADGGQAAAVAADDQRAAEGAGGASSG